MTKGEGKPNIFRKRRPVICFHICSSFLLTVRPVSLHINFELKQQMKIL